MKYIWTFLVLAVLHQAVSALDDPGSTPSDDINDKLEKKKCQGGKFPRIVNFKGCNAKENHVLKTVSRCYDCVPEGVDSVCRENGYLRAFLTFELSAYNCEPGSIDRLECPTGSVCVPNPYFDGYGVCCYGTKRTDIFQLADRTCNDCKKKCGRKQCREAVTRCGQKLLRCD